MIIIDGIITDRAVGEVLRIVDAQQSEIEYLKQKFDKEQQPKIDSEARATFFIGSTNSLIKIASRSNHYGQRYKMINEVSIISMYLRCTEDEIQEYAILCIYNE